MRNTRGLGSLPSLVQPNVTSIKGTIVNHVSIIGIDDDINALGFHVLVQEFGTSDANPNSNSNPNTAFGTEFQLAQETQESFLTKDQLDDIFAQVPNINAVSNEVINLVVFLT
jgi:hypothetical protein